MAVFRKIHVSFWSDAFVSELNDKSKLFYLYLLTNERTTQLGVYEITKKQMAYDLGYSIDTVSKLILELQNLGKIKFNDSTSEIGIKNWNRYNLNTSGKVVTLVNKEIAKIKDKKLIDFIYSIDTVSIQYPQEEEEETKEITKAEEGEKEKDSPPAVINLKPEFQFLNIFNECKKRIRGKLHKPHEMLTLLDQKNLKKILDAKNTWDDIKYAIEAMLCSDWPKSKGMDNPSHLLRNENFLKYKHIENLNQVKDNGSEPNRIDKARAEYERQFGNGNFGNDTNSTGG